MGRQTIYIMGGVLCVGILTMAKSGFAEEVRFFSSSIDYWQRPQPELPQLPTAEIKETPPPPVMPRSSEPTQVLKESEAFDWRPFLDAKHKEFFREGDYTPPEPFMEIMRNPSDANLQLWFTYIERKNALTQRLSERMQDYVRRHAATLSQPEKARVATLASQLRPSQTQNYRNLRFRMYFDSACPHCQKMIGTLNSLQERGYFVEARQIDRGSIAHLGASFTIQPATPAELKKFEVRAVPFLLIGDLRRGTVYRQTGFMTPEDILAKFPTQP